MPLKIIDVSFDSRLGSRLTLEACRLEAERLLQAWQWKSSLEPRFPLLVALMGGTGTGKSTLFNSLAGSSISEVGHRRPLTRNAVILAHEEAAPSLRKCPVVRIGMESQARGDAYEASIVTHRRAELAHMVPIDTPDIDSVEISNRVNAENFFIISDAILLVTSQEKYGDLAGHEMTQRASRWEKRTFFVMNKVQSEIAYDDFCKMVKQMGFTDDPVRIDRFDPPPDFITGVRKWPELSALFARDDSGDEADEIRRNELSLLRRASVESIATLEARLASESQRIASVNSAIARTVGEVADGMQRRVDALVTPDLEKRIRDRLQQLTVKYDILFVPRQKLRELVRSSIGTVLQWLGFASTEWLGGDKVDNDRASDLAAVRSAANLQPLESAVAGLDRRLAEMLSSDRDLDDLLSVARTDVPAWDERIIQQLYNETFPGVEQLLEAEFNHFRDGLPVTDRLKLYGWSTVWAACLVTAEIVVGGGFSLLDAVLNTAILPCIPSLVLKARVAGLLREIGERVDDEHRRTLNTVLEKRGQAYIQVFGELLPRDDVQENLRSLRMELLGSRDSGGRDFGFRPT